MPIINFGIGSQRLKNLTKEQEKIIKILSHSNKYQYEEYLRSTPEELEKALSQYTDRKPIIKELQNHDIDIQDIDYLEPSNVDESKVIKAIPILLKWLRSNNTPLHVKTEILRVLTRKPYAKKNMLDEILRQLETLPKEQAEKKGGFYSMYLTILGNAVSGWMDDDHANALFKLLLDKKFADNNFLIAALLKLKKKEYKEKAKELALQELQKPNHSNESLSMYLYILQRLKAIEAKSIVQRFLDFPQNYTRSREYGNKEDFHLVEDKHIRKVAQKTLDSFERYKSNKS